MKKLKADPQLAAWCEALAPRHEVDEVPEGWLTAAQIAIAANKNRNTALRYIGAAVAEGRAEVRKFRVPSGQRGIYPTPHYRLLT